MPLDVQSGNTLLASNKRLWLRFPSLTSLSTMDQNTAGGVFLGSALRAPVTLLSRSAHA